MHIFRRPFDYAPQHARRWRTRSPAGPSAGTPFQAAVDAGTLVLKGAAATAALGLAENPGAGQLVEKGGDATAALGWTEAGGAGQLVEKGGDASVGLGWAGDSGAGQLVEKGAGATAALGRIEDAGSGQLVEKGGVASPQLGRILAAGAGQLVEKGGSGAIVLSRVPALMIVQPPRPLLPTINPGYEITRKPAGGWVLGGPGGHVLDLGNTLPSRSQTVGSSIVRAVGDHGTVLNFTGDANNDRINLGSVPQNHPLQLLSDFAVYARVRYTDAVGNNTNGWRVIEKATAAGGAGINGWAMLYMPDGAGGSPDERFSFCINGSANADRRMANGLSINKWHNIICFYDGAINWVADGVVDSTGVSISETAANVQADLAIGNRPVDTDRNFYGDIDFIYISESIPSLDEAKFLTTPGNEYLIFQRDVDFPFAAFSVTPFAGAVDSGTLALKGGAGAAALGWAESGLGGKLAEKGGAGSAGLGWSAIASAGKLAEKGAAATIVRGFEGTVGAGDLVLKGAAALVDIGAGFLATGGAGQIVLRGALTDLARGKALSAGAGSTVLKGGAASEQLGIVMDAGAGKLALKGEAGIISLGASFVAQPGAGFLPLKGAQAALVQGRVFGPGAGKISLKGDGASVQIGVIFAPGAGILPLKGAAAVLAFETLAVYAYGEEILLVDGSFDSRIITLTGHEDIMKVFGDADIVIVYPPIEVPGDT